jgi:glyceraldehyde 3-phosphate dehydrogenase
MKTRERDPKNLPWGDLGIDIVMECTGIFTAQGKGAIHLEAGAKRVLVSAPSAGATRPSSTASTTMC